MTNSVTYTDQNLPAIAAAWLNVVDAAVMRMLGLNTVINGGTWTSGTPYAEGTITVSPANGSLYLSAASVTSANDPSTDPVNWVPALSVTTQKNPVSLLTIPPVSVSLSSSIVWPTSNPSQMIGPGAALVTLNFPQADGSQCIDVGAMSTDNAPAILSGFKVNGTATNGNGALVGTNAVAGHMDDIWWTGLTGTGKACVLYSTSFIGTNYRGRFFDSSVGIACAGANGIVVRDGWAADNTNNVTISATSQGSYIHLIENGFSSPDPTKKAQDVAGNSNWLFNCFTENGIGAQYLWFESSAYNNVLNGASRGTWGPWDDGYDNKYPATNTAPYAYRQGMYRLTGPTAASGDALQQLAFDSSFENSSGFIQYGATAPTITQSTTVGRRDLFSCKADWGTTALSGMVTAQTFAVTAGQYFKATFWMMLSRDQATSERWVALINGAGNQNRFESDPVQGMKQGIWYPIEISGPIGTTESVSVRAALNLDSGSTHAALVVNTDDLTVSINAKEHTTVYNPATAATRPVAFAGEYHNRALFEQLFSQSGTQIGTVGCTTWNVVGPITPNVTTEFVASTYSIGATEFNAIGSGHRGRIWINAASNGDVKQPRLYVGGTGGTNIFDAGSATPNGVGGYIDYEVKRRDATHLIAVTYGDVGGRIAPKYTLVSLAQNTASSLTFTLTNPSGATDSVLEDITGTSI